MRETRNVCSILQSIRKDDWEECRGIQNFTEYAKGIVACWIIGKEVGVYKTSQSAQGIVACWMTGKNVGVYRTSQSVRKE
jgi:hypothetical protein